MVAAPVRECLELFEAVESYPAWYPEVVKEVSVLERDAHGRARRVDTTLHVSRGPLVRDFDLVMAITVRAPGTVRLVRVRNEPSDPERFEVIWRVKRDGHTRIDLQLDANLAVPRMVPLGGIGDAMAEGFIAAAVKALR